MFASGHTGGRVKAECLSGTVCWPGPFPQGLCWAGRKALLGPPRENSVPVTTLAVPLSIFLRSASRSLLIHPSWLTLKGHDLSHGPAGSRKPTVTSNQEDWIQAIKGTPSHKPCTSRDLLRATGVPCRASVSNPQPTACTRPRTALRAAHTHS